MSEQITDRPVRRQALFVRGVHPAGKDGYPDSALPGGHTPGTPEDALDTACRLHPGDPIAWI